MRRLCVADSTAPGLVGSAVERGARGRRLRLAHEVWRARSRREFRADCERLFDAMFGPASGWSTVEITPDAKLWQATGNWSTVVCAAPPRTSLLRATMV